MRVKASRLHQQSGSCSASSSSAGSGNRLDRATAWCFLDSSCRAILIMVSMPFISISLSTSFWRPAQNFINLPRILFHVLLIFSSCNICNSTMSSGQSLHMNRGEGEASYARNSTTQVSSELICLNRLELTCFLPALFCGINMLSTCSLCIVLDISQIWLVVKVVKVTKIWSRISFFCTIFRS